MLLVANLPGCPLFRVLIKDAGFVNKSFRIETNRVILKNKSSETNPQNESYLFHAIEFVRISEDSLDS
jgi:hypothetical protein